MTKKLILTLAALSIILGVLFALMSASSDSELKPHASDIYSDSLLHHLNSLITNHQIDTAATYIQILLNDKEGGRISPSLRDTLRYLDRQIGNLLNLDSNNLYISVLLDLSDREYNQLKQNQLHKTFLAHPVLNALYIQKLFNRTNNYGSNKALQESSSSYKELRRSYARNLKESFLELGFEIDITVTGKDNTSLILSSPIFDDEWFTKFENSGDVAEWHNMGFKRVELINNSNYHKTKHWN
jgi:hypothetical protein